MKSYLVKDRMDRVRIIPEGEFCYGLEVLEVIEHPPLVRSLGEENGISAVRVACVTSGVF